jgi:outer membrane protein TolC
MSPVLWLALAALAQAPVLTLEEALEQAKRQNLDLLAAKARLTQARQLSRKAWSGYLPQLSVGGNYAFSSSEARIALPAGFLIRDVGAPQGPEFDPTREPSIDNPPGRPTPYLVLPSELIEAEIQRRHQLSGQVQLTQAVLAPTLWPAIQSAYLAEQVTALTVESARREVLFAVAQLYYGAEGLREAVQVQARLLEVALGHERDAELQLRQGTAPKVAVLRAQIERARTEQDLRRTQNAYAAARSSLAALLDREPDFEVTRPAPPPELDQRARAEQEALSRRPDVQASRLGLELAELGRTGALYRYLPTVGLVGRYQLSNVSGFTGEYGSFSAGVGLNWTLWDGGLREAELQEAAAKIVESRAQARAAEVRARDELRRARLDWESALANRVKADEQARLAVENAELVQRSFEAGVATYLEVVDATVARRGAELAQINEQLNAELAALRIARAAGLFSP